MKSADRKGYVATCNFCGKQSSSGNMPNHIEANHITGVSHACDTCGKTSRTRDALWKHMNRHRKESSGPIEKSKGAAPNPEIWSKVEELLRERVPSIDNFVFKTISSTGSEID